MAKVLRLYNSFWRTVKEARLADGSVIETLKWNDASPKEASLYICGPTVYSDSHLGHALTYARADIFRRIAKSIFGIRLITVMNITDVDDKILKKARQELPNDSADTTTDPACHPFNRISEKYYKSFLDDMNYINVIPPDLTIKVSKQVDLITRYIGHLENSGHAYLATNGDVYFNVSALPSYEGRLDERNDGRAHTDLHKRDIRDFALWKATRPGEPVWLYESTATGKKIPGRPGWHVQCSAICSAIFGNKLDFHYGGKDLIFPHHYNEQACCCAYHNLDTSRTLHVWSENWLHSGHLVLRNDKMSKSLGNVVGIRKFINETSLNALRLICVAFHYRADVNFNEELLSTMRSLDHRLTAFISYINEALSNLNEVGLEDTTQCHGFDISATIQRVHDEIVTGICDDLDLAKGLYSILDLSKVVYNAGSENLKAKDLVLLWHLLVEWSSMCGLDYKTTKIASDSQVLFNLVKGFRQDIRDMALGQIKKNESQTGQDGEKFLPKKLLEKCDDIRARMDELGFVVRDRKT